MTEVKRKPGRPRKNPVVDKPVLAKEEVKATVALPPLKVISRTISRTGGVTPDGGIPITEFENYVISYMNLGYKLHTSEIVDRNPNEITLLFILIL